MGAFKGVEIFGCNELIKNLSIKKENAWTVEAFEDWKKNEPDYGQFIIEIEILIPESGFESNFTISDNNYKVDFFYSGGHTGCSSCAYFPNEKILFSGDEIAAGFWPFISDPTGDPEKWIRSLEYMLTLDIQALIPGHGSVVKKEYVKEQLVFMKALKRAILNAISENKDPNDLNLPESPCKPAEDWQIPRALDFLYKYYSDKK
jgi:glyoxylase-like metal-dependent hydrolase (beta-lactamase superfamily II)